MCVYIIYTCIFTTMDTPQKLLVLQVTNNWKRDVPVEVKSIEAAILCSVCSIIATN